MYLSTHVTCEQRTEVGCTRAPWSARPCRTCACSRTTLPSRTTPRGPAEDHPCRTVRTARLDTTVNTQNTCVSVHHCQHTEHLSQCTPLSTQHTSVNMMSAHITHVSTHITVNSGMCQDDVNILHKCVNIHHCQHTENLSTHKCQPYTPLSTQSTSVSTHTTVSTQNFSVNILSTHSPQVSTYTTVNKHTAD